MTSRWKLLPAFIIAVTMAARTLPAATIDGIAATVNGEVITLLDLEKAAKPLVDQKLRTTLKRERPKVKREVLRSVLDQLVLRALQLQRAKELRIRVGDAEVGAAIANIRKSNSLTEEMLARALKEQGLTDEQYREQIREQIIFSKLMQQEVRARITVTAEEVELYYQDHEQDYYKPERIRVRHLFIKVEEDAGDEGIQSARRTALTIIEEFNNGSDFADLIGEHSSESVRGEDSVSGWLRRGEFLEELEDVAFSLPVGRLSEPIRSQAGFHLIQLVDREEASQMSLPTVADSITEKLTREKMESSYKEWLQELKENSHIAILY